MSSKLKGSSSSDGGRREDNNIDVSLDEIQHLENLR